MKSIVTKQNKQSLGYNTNRTLYDTNGKYRIQIENFVPYKWNIIEYKWKLYNTNRKLYNTNGKYRIQIENYTTQMEHVSIQMENITLVYKWKFYNTNEKL
jgi:hypothetical protein